jgi:hypothetical protein
MYVQINGCADRQKDIQVARGVKRKIDGIQTDRRIGVYK